MVSAALKNDSIPSRALLLGRERHTIALSSVVYSEIEAVPARPKFSPALTMERRAVILGLLSAAAIWVEPTATIADCRDAKDNNYLELAIDARADAIISSDDDLLVLDPWRLIRIIRPRDFLAMA